MPQPFNLDRRDWGEASSPSVVARAQAALEAGRVILFTQLAFALEPAEEKFLTPSILAGSRKNASYDPATDDVGGTNLAGADAEALARMIRRFGDSCTLLIERLFPAYRPEIVRARGSFRPADIAERVMSWRKDDTRLHVDAFPANPSNGKRILRMFCNVNPTGAVRTWRIGDEFESVARRFDDQLHIPLPGVSGLLALAHITKTARSRYDSLMLQLHDRMKADSAFQSNSPQATVDFPAGSTWMAFTDQVSHAAMAGQHQLEQTFLLPLAAMREPERSPLRVLERIKHRQLA